MTNVVVVLGLASALVGCWRDLPSPAPAVPRTSTLALGPCPSVLKSFMTSSWWAHELFPGCSPPPFNTDGIACVGACPMPCSMTSTGNRSDSRHYTFTWNHGQLSTVDGITTTADDDGKPQTTHEQCEYDAGRIVRCASVSGPVEIHRDLRGRIVEVVERDNAIAVTYDGAGGVIELAGRNGYAHSRLRYDDNHRLIAEDDVERDGSQEELTRFKYDARGRFVHADFGQLEHRYDASTGLLAETVQRFDNGDGPVTEKVRISYDDKARPIRILSVTTPENEHGQRYDGLSWGPDRVEDAYSYTCPTPR
jgi:YD repeat-containing protein